MKGMENVLAVELLKGVDVFDVPLLVVSMVISLMLLADRLNSLGKFSQDVQNNDIKEKVTKSVLFELNDPKKMEAKVEEMLTMTRAAVLTRISLMMISLWLPAAD
jgi:hypothetical protein